MLLLAATIDSNSVITCGPLIIQPSAQITLRDEEGKEYLAPLPPIRTLCGIMAMAHFLGDRDYRGVGLSVQGEGGGVIIPDILSFAAFREDAMPVRQTGPRKPEAAAPAGSSA